MWAGDSRRLAPVRKVLEASALVISPIVALELQLLFEIGRTTVPGREVVAGLVEKVGLRVASLSFASAAEHAAPLDWTRDPFDRLIVATSIAEGAPLLTRDRTIRANHRAARWAR